MTLHWGYLIVIVILVLLAIGIGVAYYFLYIRYRKTYTSSNCSVDSNCPVAGYCDNKRCKSRPCKTNTDCPGSQSCILGYCSVSNCTSSCDCASIEACNSDGKCVLRGKLDSSGKTVSCTDNSDCWSNMTCTAGICTQCKVDKDCPSGLNCISGLCVNSCTPANCPNIGPTGMCGTGLNCMNQKHCCEGTMKTCGSSSDCANNGKSTFCVNGNCDCQAGEVFDKCTSNSDCSSGQCMADPNTSNKVCWWKNTDCLYSSYSIADTKKPGYCNDPSTPYCVDGLCTADYQGSYCGPNIKPSLPVCTVLSYNGDGDNPGLQQTGKAYCIDNYCSQVSGWLGDHCSGNTDCTGINVANGQMSLVCTKGICVNNS